MNRKPLLLGVNIDHCATIRQARYRDMEATAGGMIEPDPVFIALLSERAGADGITVHLREDRRHIRDRDIYRLRESIQTRMNLEMACTREMIDIALDVKPDSVCLVPENREEVTTEGGLDIIGQESRVREVIDALAGTGIKISLFIDPDLKQVEQAARLGAPWIELHTGSYAHACFNENRGMELAKLTQAAAHGHQLGLTVNAGHGINYQNIPEVREIPHLHELNIGHTIISRSITVGIEEAVREMKRLMNPGF